MKKPISVYAVNATVQMGMTPSGEDNYTIRLDNDAGDAVDRIQKCYDFRLPLSYSLVDGRKIFSNGYDYIAFSMYPRDSESNYLVTCRCNHIELDQDKALELVEKGMRRTVREIGS